MESRIRGYSREARNHSFRLCALLVNIFNNFRDCLRRINFAGKSKGDKAAIRRKVNLKDYQPVRGEIVGLEAVALAGKGAFIREAIRQTELRNKPLNVFIGRKMKKLSAILLKQRVSHSR